MTYFLCHPAYRQAGTSWFKTNYSNIFYNHSNPSGLKIQRVS
jgi:hypothetical protein